MTQPLNPQQSKHINPIPLTQIIERLEKLYTNLEYVAIHESLNLSYKGKRNVKVAQAEIQLIRLALYNLLQERNNH